MTYKDLEQACLYYGFLACPISVSDCVHALAMGVPADSLYSVACDVAAGFSLDEAIAAAAKKEESNND